MAQSLGEIFKRVGAEVGIGESYTAPLSWHISKLRPNAKTIIFYYHYDTVPADADQVWAGILLHSVRDGIMYGP